MTTDELLAMKKASAPELHLIWTAVVDIAERQDFGETPAGHRYMVPILGGSFHAGPGIDGLSGQVLPGGADRQLLTESGFKTLDALYEMQTEDGEVLTVHNQVCVDDSFGTEPYRLSVIKVTAPKGRFAWMNRRVFVGTLDSARPNRDAVIIRGWGLGEV